jgi:hypothetical protein
MLILYLSLLYAAKTWPYDKDFKQVTGNTKGGCITVPLTSFLTGLDQSVLQIKTKIISSHTTDSKPVKQEVNGPVIRPPLVFPVSYLSRQFHLA